MAACRIITSPITGKEVTSDTWNNLYELSGQNEQEADRLYEQLLSPAFLAWFGNWLEPNENVSKLVTRYGEPGIVYHGTKNKFNTFDKNLMGTETLDSLKTEGFWFAYTKDVAEDFGNNIMPSFLNIKKPFTAETKLSNNYIKTFPDQVLAVNTAIEDGYDSAIIDVLENIESGNATREIVVFNTNQIKSVFNKGEFSPSSDNIYLSTGDKLLSSKANAVTLEFMEEFLDRIGVDIFDVSRQAMKDGLARAVKDYDGKKVAYGIADLGQRVAWILEGKHDVALTEEAMHFAVAITKQLNPTLYKEMLNAASKYKLTADVIADPDYRKMYTDESTGKPNIPKLKEEALGKIIAEYVIKGIQGDEIDSPELIQQAQGWWQKILNWFKSKFSKVAVETGDNILQRFAASTYEGTFEGTAEDIEESGIMYSVASEAQTDTYNSIIETSNIVKLIDNKYINQTTGENIMRVSELKKERKPSFTRTEEEQELDNQSAAYGTRGHADIEDIAKRYIDDDGFIRKDASGNLAPLPQVNVSQLSSFTNGFYDELEKNFVQRLELLTDGFKDNTRFLVEQVIYDPKFRGGKGIAGTVDLMTIKEDGTVNIYDWKFMQNIDKQTEDILAPKKEDFNLQLTEYKRIIKEAYGVKNVAQARVIPIKVTYNIDSGVKTLRSMFISPVDVNSAQYDFELPLPIESERTGSKAIDTQIDKLQALYKKVKSVNVTDTKSFIKNEQLNQILKAVRYLQVKQDIDPLLDFIKLLDHETKDIKQTFDNVFKDKDPKQFEDKELSKFTKRILDVRDKYQLFKEILQLKELAPQDYEFQKDVNEIHARIEEYSGKDGVLNNLLKTFMNDFVAKRERVKDYLATEKETKGIVAQVRGPSQGGTKDIELFYNILSRYHAKIDVERNIALEKYEKISTAYKDWANSKGFDNKNMFNVLFDSIPNKEGFTNQLIDTLDKEFFEQFKKAKETKDYKWIEENIDLAKYKEAANAFLEQKIKEIEDFPYYPDPIKNKEEQTKRIAYYRDKYNFNAETSFGYYDNMAENYPTEKWYSKEYKYLLEGGNEPALEFFKYIQTLTKEAADLAMISEYNQRKFVPFIRKSTMEKLMYNEGFTKGIKPLQSLLDSLSIQEDDYGYEHGYRDPINGEVTYDLKPRFVSDFLVKERPEDISTDLLLTIQTFQNEVIRFRNLSTIHDTMKGVLEVTRMKNSIQTDVRGRPIKENGEIMTQDQNEVNYRHLYDLFLLNFHDIKNIDGGFLEATLGKFGVNAQKYCDSINEYMKMNIMPTDIQGKELSLPKFIEAARKYYQLNVLGFNVSISTINTLGGAAQLIVNAGDYYTTKEATFYDFQAASLAFNGTKDIVAVELIRVLEPYVDKFDTQKRRKTTASQLGNFDFIADFMMLGYKSARAIEIVHALAMFNNAIVIDGEVLNVNKYLSEKYRDRFETLDYTQRQELDKKIVEEKQTLLKEKGLLENTSIKDNELVLPDSLTLTSPSLLRYRNVTINLITQALGATSPEDKSKAKGNALLRSMLTFKSWIPPLSESRFSELKYSPGTERWEYGRMRAFVKGFVGAAHFNVIKYIDLVKMNDNGVKMMDEMFNAQKEKWESRKGTELSFIDKGEYIELYQRALKNQSKDVLFLLTLTTILVSASRLLGDDDDPETKSYSSFALRMLNKMHDEFVFFYSPASIADIANGSILPPLSLAYDIKALLSNIAQQGYGFAVENDEIMESAKPLKYALRLTPLTRNLMYYAAVASPDIKKALDVKITSQARAR